MNFITPRQYFAFAIFTASFLSSVIVCGQKAEPINSNQGEIVTLHSEILKEDRKIMIYAPKDSVNLNEAHPVLYVLDAENHFNQMVEFSKLFGRHDVDVAPPFIVVGIRNTDRVRDLTPSHSDLDYSGKPEPAFKTSGGNEQFFKFIEKELIPFVESNYLTQPYRIFGGHSFGGLTIINCLINHPDLFNAYIAASPSFWWDRQNFLKLLEKELKAGKTLNKTLFFSDGSEGGVFHSDVLKFDSLVRKSNIKGLDFKYVHYPDEDHNMVPLKTYYDGLRFVYRPWSFRTQLSAEEVNAQMVIKHYDELSQKFGYTVLPDQEFFKGWGEYILKKPQGLNNGISLLEMNIINYPTSSKAFVALAEAYVLKGEKAKAIESYKRAEELDPGSKEIKSRLQELQK